MPGFSDYFYDKTLRKKCLSSQSPKYLFPSSLKSSQEVSFISHKLFLFKVTSDLCVVKYSNQFQVLTVLHPSASFPTGDLTPSSLKHFNLASRTPHFLGFSPSTSMSAPSWSLSWVPSSPLTSKHWGSRVQFLDLFSSLTILMFFLWAHLASKF